MKKIYFMSDSHLGVPDYVSSLAREKKLVRWLDQVSPDAEEIFLLGDIFDFWFEYSKVVPKGYTRLFGKLAEVSDKGIPIHFFTGNHDMWVLNYFKNELGLLIHREPLELTLQGKKVFVGHGDGLGSDDRSYKFLKKFFSWRFPRLLFSLIPPRLGIGFANYLSKMSRLSHSENDRHFLGEEKEHLILFSKELLKKRRFDYFIFGHRHYPIMLDLEEGVGFINTGDWIRNFSYAEMENGIIALKYFKHD